MSSPTVDSLLLTDEERAAARSQIAAMAYHKWQSAGCPDGHSLKFWTEAEREWIEYFYVPQRNDLG